ncbi:GNAT family N-acetyltransferase [Echinimonas agarilytica]|uniref:GNAT family N-acetyltransferase n=1 Tax=Echinimonas agarilytica TaxID=1215918 RepID=A0AA41W5G3_9GAMM|nr:GNAT family N-acetyltransferase [Echinimonas agarilytica]MCM2679215.1 GNAT family N-acetyltransferase [Echinimonas agarilytica]
MIEQNSLYRDLDGYDENAWHLMLFDQQALIGYARLVPPERPGDVVKLGRLVVAKNYRKQGVAQQMMKTLIQFSSKDFPNSDITLSAQIHLTEFYSGLGFKVRGESYDDGGIEHVDMFKTA